MIWIIFNPKKYQEIVYKLKLFMRFYDIYYLLFMECPNCHTINATDSKYCRNCRYSFSKDDIFEMVRVFTQVGVRNLTTSTIIIPPEYYSIDGYGSSEMPHTFEYQDFFVARANIVKSDLTSCVYDSKGSLVIPSGKYENIFYDSSLSLFICQSNGKKDISGGVYVFSTQGMKFLYSYPNIQLNYKNGVPAYALNKHGLYGYIDIATGKELLPFK